jgi:hypothetical protein
MAHDISVNYDELVRVGNPEGENTAKLSMIVYMAKSLSTLPEIQLTYLRENGILKF